MGGVLHGGGNEVGQAVLAIEAVGDFGEAASCMFQLEGVTAAAQGRLPACSITNLHQPVPATPGSMALVRSP